MTPEPFDLARLSRPELEALALELSRATGELVDLYMRGLHLIVAIRADLPDLADRVDPAIGAMTAELEAFSAVYIDRIAALKAPAPPGMIDPRLQWQPAEATAA